MEGLKKFLNRETVLYLVFGAATTVVNYAVFWLVYRLLWGGEGSLYANAAAFAAAVVFAFVVNKCFVFESKSWALSVLVREIPAFVAAYGSSVKFTADVKSPAFTYFLKKNPAGKVHKGMPAAQTASTDPLAILEDFLAASASLLLEGKS